MAFVSISISPESQRLIAQWQQAPTRVVESLDAAFSQFIIEVESSVKTNELSGGEVGVRSGALRQAFSGEVDGPLSGFVGTTRGTTTPYAKTILGPDTTTIRPVNAKHLWVPIAANLNPSGIALYTPKALFDTFGDRVKIFESKKGNTVVFVEDAKPEGGSTPRFKRNTKAGRNKGDVKGKLYFVLKDQVIIQGTDALAKGATRMIPRGEELLTKALRGAFPPGGAGANMVGGTS